MDFRIAIPAFTRILLAVLLSVSVTHQLTRYIFHSLPIEFLALTPQHSVFSFWTYVTATFAEENPISLIVATFVILLGGRYLERAWGSREFGKFVLLVVLVPNIAAALIYILWFAITLNSDRALAHIQGSVALQAAFLVAFKQLVPEHTVTILKGVVKIRVKHFPAIFLIANTISGIVIGTDTALVLAWAGFFTSWIYLRFYKRQPELSGTDTSGVGIKGDASETFAFACFWPDAVQPPISVIADPADVESSNIQASARGEGSLPSLANQSRRGGKREEAERRRALALKVLDQRLQAATAGRQQPQSTASSAPTEGGTQSPGAQQSNESQV